MEPVVPSDPGPSNADLARVERSVTALGGNVLEDPCRAEHVHTLGADVWTCGCGGQTRVAIPYDGPGKFVTMCAVCDCAHQMPRLQP